MLVLSFAVGDVLRLSNGVRITVLNRTNGQTKLGIQAPTEIAVRRVRPDPSNRATGPVQPAQVPTKPQE